MSLNANYVSELGLNENSDYRLSLVEVFHSPSDRWVELLETRSKIVFYLDEGDDRKASVKSISEVRFNEDGKPPVSLEKKEEKSQVDMKDFPGLVSNTDYRGEDMEVNHVNKGWFPLVRSANKVVYYNENGSIRRLTPKKYGGFRTAGSCSSSTTSSSTTTSSTTRAPSFTIR